MIHATILRPATEPDVTTLQRLLDEDPNNKVRSVRNGSQTLDEVVYVIEHAGNYAGFCTYRFGADEIFPLVVFNDFRRKGIGAEAARQLIDILRQRGVTELGIEIMPGAEQFWSNVFSGYQYRDHGFGKYTVAI